MGNCKFLSITCTVSILDHFESSNLGDEKGLQMALGNLDINTMERIDDFSPDRPFPQVSDHYRLKKSRWSNWSATFNLEQHCKFLFSLLNHAVKAGMTHKPSLGPVSGAEASSRHVLPRPCLLVPQVGLHPPGGRRESSTWTVWDCPAESCRWRDHEKVSCLHAVCIDFCMLFHTSTPI